MPRPPSFPPPVARALAPDHAAAAVPLARPWPGLVWAAGDRWVWAAPPGSGRARAEAGGLALVGPHLPCPAVVFEHGEWLVTTVPAGHPATRPERQPRPDEVPSAIGAALRRLHDLDPSTVLRSGSGAERLPGSSESLVAAILEALAGGAIDPAALPDPYRRYGPADLVTIVADGAERSAAAARRAGDAEVVNHGDPVVGNWFLDGGELAGVTGLHRAGPADRHLDLAIAYRSITDHFGPEAVFGFVDAYGTDPDLIRLDHHLLVGLLADQLHPAHPVADPPPADAPSPEGQAGDPVP
ncbi:MAG: phosphotransferase [Acidimicrobiales bacterium]